jgi:hypothetical protein
MTYQCPPRSWPDSDPAPNVPTLEEIQFAEELRHRLELRLLAGTDVRTPRFGAAEYDWGVRYVAIVRRGGCDHALAPPFGAAFNSRGTLRSTRER